MSETTRVRVSVLAPIKNGPSAPGVGFRRLILLTCAVALGAYHVFASASMYPIPGGDAAFFMPAAINLKAGRGLTNSLWDVNPDPTGQHRYLEHPPLFQMVVSACMWKAETRNAFIILAIFNALTLALYAAFLCTAKFVRKLIASVAGFAVLVSSIFALAFLIFTDAVGRPEPLSTLILALAIGVVTWLPRKCWPICLGFAIGIAAAIHPVHGIFIACLVAVAFLHSAPLSRAIREIMVAAALALSLFWVLLSLSPYPVLETLQAVAGHSALVNKADYRISTLTAFYLRLAPWTGLYLLGLSLVLIWCGIYFWRSPADRTTRSIRLVALLLAAFAFQFFSIRRPNSSHYLVMLAPALIAGAFYLFDAASVRRDRRLAAGPVWTFAVFFGMFSLCLARDIALFIDYRTEGISFAEAQKDFDHLARSTGQVISVSESFWVLTDKFERIRIVERGTTSGDLMVLQQSQRGSLTPPVIPGYRLQSQHFISHPPRWFGLPIAHTMPGYSFAVFARVTSLEDNGPRTSGQFTPSDSIVIPGIARLHNQLPATVDRLPLCHGS